MSSLEDIIEPSWNFIKKSGLGLTLCATVLAYSSCKKREPSSQNQPQKNLVEAEESPIKILNKYADAVREDNYGKALDLYLTEKEAKDLGGEDYIDEYRKGKESFADGFNKLSTAIRNKEIELLEVGGEINEKEQEKIKGVKNYEAGVFDAYFRLRKTNDGGTITTSGKIVDLITTKEGKWRLICW